MHKLGQSLGRLIHRLELRASATLQLFELVPSSRMATESRFSLLEPPVVSPCPWRSFNASVVRLVPA